jgi:hypothetical protein
MGVYNRNGEEFNFNLYTTLRAYDKLEFVNFVVNTVVDDDYNSVIKNIMFDIAIVHFLTDIDVSNIIKSIDKNDIVINKIEDFLYETNIVEVVKSNAAELIDELTDAVNDNIEYRTGIHKNPIAESLSSLLNTIEKKVSDINTDEMMKMAKIISGMTGKLTPEKIIEAYSKSDLFKQNHNQTITENEPTDVEGVKKTKNSKKSATKQG